MADGLAGIARLVEPERAHRAAIAFLRTSGAFSPLGALTERMWAPPPAQPVELLGLTFPNRVGLAAGFDKDGVALRGLARLGLGHIEIGTVTRDPQPGNLRPRIFRLPEKRSLINRMGFPNRGASSVADRLRRIRPPGLVVGVNIGKGAATPIDKALNDYTELLDRFAPLADYMTINVSSPNTPGLRLLAGEELLPDLLSGLRNQRAKAAARLGRHIPLLVKLSPDIDDPGLDSTLEVILGASIDGVVATNTTVGRPGLTGAISREEGGLSGAVLTDLATTMVAEIYKRTGGTLPIIASGGVMSADDARAKIEAGASLVQVYTGFVYRGPRLIREIVTAVG